MTEQSQIRREVNRERMAIASQIADIARRIGPAAKPEWVKDQLDQLVNELDRWIASDLAHSPPQVDKATELPDDAPPGRASKRDHLGDIFYIIEDPKC